MPQVLLELFTHVSSLGNPGMLGLEAELLFHANHQTPPVCAAAGGGVRSGGCLGLVDVGIHMSVRGRDGATERI